MTYSINTNAGALVALQNLTSTQMELAKTQNVISTGKTINTAADNGAVWSIANTMTGKVTALNAVKDSLNRASSTIDVAMSAGQQVSDLLSQLKAQALAASDTSLNTASRTSLNQNFKALLTELSTVVSNAAFNGVNMINSGGTTIYALASDSGSSKITIAVQSLALGGSNVTIAATASFATAAAASAYVATLTTSIANVNTALTNFGTGSNAIASQLKCVLPTCVDAPHDRAPPQHSPPAP